MTKPYKYQRVGWRQITKFDGRALLADEMGLGKTFQSIMWMDRNPHASPIVIVCPAFLKYNWAHELLIHADLTPTILEGKKPSSIESTDLIVINYDIIGSWLNELIAIEPQLLIIDEAQYIMNTTSKRCKYVKHLAKGIPYVLGLTGTPFLNSPIEIWSILNIIRPDVFPNEWQFAMRYCNPRRTPWGWNKRGVNKKRLLELNQVLTDTCMIRRLKKDVLQDLPEKRQQVVLVDIKRRKEYEHATDNFLDWLRKTKGNHKAKRAASAERLVQMGYLLRLAAELKLSSVMEWIDTFLSESSEKLVLFGKHKLFLGKLHDRYNKISIKITGDTPPKERKILVDQFQSSKKIRLIVGNMKAAGVGLNMTAASTVGILELEWNPATHSQAIDRVHRLGQKKQVDAYFLVAKDTIEEYLCELNQKKQLSFSGAIDGHESAEDFNLYDQLEQLIIRSRQ